MAQGRMLKRKITKSKKMAALKTDKARLLWFYLLPFTDVEGRLEADLEDIREDILRKQRKRFSLQRIQQCLDDLHRVGLIILYNVNGKQYLQYTRFLDEQTIRTDKEAKSAIPHPSTGQVQELDGRTTAISLKKEKLKESKYSELFEKFWKAFKGRWDADLRGGVYVKGSKLEAWEVWEKMSDTFRQKAIAGTPKSGGKFTPDCCRWLKQQRWET